MVARKSESDEDLPFDVKNMTIEQLKATATITNGKGGLLNFADLPLLLGELKGRWIEADKNKTEQIEPQAHDDVNQLNDQIANQEHQPKNELLEEMTQKVDNALKLDNTEKIKNEAEKPQSTENEQLSDDLVKSPIQTIIHAIKNLL